MVSISNEFYKYSISILYSGKDETKSKDGIENVKQEIDDSKKLVKCFFVVLHIFDNSLSRFLAETYSSNKKENIEYFMERSNQCTRKRFKSYSFTNAW